jgi:hypothetical protein
MKCPNCSTALSCGCQQRTASNGAQVCSSCIQAYEHNLQIQRQNANNSNNTSYNNV